MLREEMASFNEKGARPNDTTSGVRDIFEDDAVMKRKNSAGETVTIRAKDTLDMIYQGESGVKPRQQQLPYSLPPPKTPPPPSITYAEKGQPASLTYEDLLKIESEMFVDQRLVPGLSMSKQAQLSGIKPRRSYEYVIDRQPINITTRKSGATKGSATRGYFRPTLNSPGMSEGALRSTGVNKQDLLEMMQGSLKRMDDSARKARKK